MSNPLLKIKNLNLSIGDTAILKDLNFELKRGEITGMVGESGSGKSMSALSIMKLLPQAAQLSGEIEFNGQNLIAASEREMDALRGDDIGMVFQEPMTALNPTKTIGEQVAEGVRLHTRLNKRDALDKAALMLERVGLPQAQFSLDRFPHALSGGQRQRVVIAIACALKPKLLIADEPTTALDVTTQAQILDLLRELVEENDMSLLLISHDLAVVAEHSDKCIIMRHGEILDQGETLPLLRAQTHPYTKALAKASTHVPKRTKPIVTTADMIAQGKLPLIEIKNLSKFYPRPRQSWFKKAPPFQALNNISFSLYQGQSIGLVGESGCGKSTLARALLGLEPINSGQINFDGQDFATASADQIKAIRRNMQVVFQDPFGSFNPRHMISRIVTEPLYLLPKLSRSETTARAEQALIEVGLSGDDLDKYPHEFSGGQRQRISIARALITQPKLIIADEAVSALDVSIRATVLDLLSELREKFDLTYLFISHDLSVVRAITDEVMIMKQGEIVERGTTANVFDNPQQSYTSDLLRAAPNLELTLRVNS